MFLSKMSLYKEASDKGTFSYYCLSAFPQGMAHWWTELKMALFTVANLLMDYAFISISHLDFIIQACE